MVIKNFNDAIGNRTRDLSGFLAQYVTFILNILLFYSSKIIITTNNIHIKNLEVKNTLLTF
jgi:hypothetical protein